MIIYPTFFQGEAIMMILLEWLKNSPEILDDKVEPSVSLIVDHFHDVNATNGHIAVTLALLLATEERARMGAIEEIVELAKVLK